MKRAVVVLALVLGCSKQEPAPPTSAPATASSGEIKIDPALVGARVAVGKVERRIPRGERRLPGEVRTTEKGRAEAGTLVAGRISTLEVALGDHVTKGQVLAWVDAPELGRAVADLLRARARATVAQNKLERQLELEKQNATSKNAVDEARAEALVAQADVAAARTAVFTLGGSEPSGGAVGVRLAVRSPIDGVISKRDAVLGAPVSPDKSLFEITSQGANDAFVLARVPETFPLPPAGTIARLYGRAKPDEAACTAKTGTDVGVVDEATRTRALRLTPEGACALLVPGAFVDVALPTTDATTKPELVVPREAIVDVHGAKVVFVGKDATTFVSRPVRVSMITGLDAIIDDGLKEGESVAIKGGVLLKGELLKAELE